MLLIDQFFLLLLLLFAILALQQPRLRIAIIYLGVFSLLVSFAYLQHQAPDVAMAEAVIGSTLATVLYLVALRKQESIREKKHIVPKSILITHRRIVMNRLIAMLATAGMAVLFFLHYPLEVAPWQDMHAADYYRTRFLQETGAENAVAAIYLNYRVYDTIFETLTLMVSVMGVIFFSRYHRADHDLPLESTNPAISGRIRVLAGHDEAIATPMINLLYPFIFLLGFYTIINGHMTPGGGFQGGAILSAILILRYITMPENDLRLAVMQLLEKVLFLFVIFVPVIYIFGQTFRDTSQLNTYYLMLMNTLIGLKVCLGISIVIIRFVFYEGR